MILMRLIANRSSTCSSFFSCIMDMGIQKSFLRAI